MIKLPIGRRRHAKPLPKNAGKRGVRRKSDLEANGGHGNITRN